MGLLDQEIQEKEREFAQMNRHGRETEVEALLKGTWTDRQRLEEHVKREGWRVISRPSPEAFPSDGRDYAGVYVLGVPVLQGPGCWAECEAVQQVESLADDVGVDLEPRHASPQGRRRCVQPKWYVCLPARTAGRALPRWVFNTARKWGLHDTGEILVGPLAWAQARAGGRSLRAPYGGDEDSHDQMPRMISDEQRRTLIQMLTFSYGAGLCGGWASGAGPWWEITVAALLAFGLLVVTYKLAARTVSSRRRLRAGTASFVSCGWLFALGALAGLQAVVFIGASLLVLHGVRLLVRTGSKRPFLVAAGLALLPVVLPPALGMGVVLHTFYGAAFGVPPEEMDIAHPSQILASLRVLVSTTSLALVFLACWGYATYYLKAVTDRLLVPLMALIAVMALGLAWLITVPESPQQAGEQAVAQWRNHRVPEPYEGIKVEPVCVTPLGALDEMPAYGRSLQPSKVYAAFGVVDGKITLWDPEEDTDFSVPADGVRALRAGTGKPGDPIPRSCSKS
ncbi:MULTISPECIES: hypothetical protein [unclassified Streptomyces]|uniref:hypothetical protein n=1 Tax=unclassified Streptomyces TaxID=2593676 RepID=UPI00380FBB0D